MQFDPGVVETRFSLQDQDGASLASAQFTGRHYSPSRDLSVEFSEAVRLLQAIPSLQGGGGQPLLAGDSAVQRSFHHEHRQLRAFLSSERNPERWFRENFGFDPGERMQTIVAPLALIFVVETIPFNNFVNRHGLYFPPNYVIGTNLQAHEKLPEELHGKVVAVSQGDLNRFVRPADEIDQSIKHEYLHVLNNRVVSPAPFLSERDLREQLLKAYDYPFLEPYSSLARKLGHGMFEHARSEIISYAGTGDFSINSDNLHAFFWTAHFGALQSVITPERYEPQFRFNILREFHRAHAEYNTDVRALYRLAKCLPREAGSLTAESIATLMLISREELNARIPGSLPIAA